MSGIRESAEIPQSVPKLEAELVRDAYETTRQNGRHTDDGPDNGTAIALSDAERRDLRQRIRNSGVSKETMVALGFDAGDE